jgi:Amt family ammonium transporter
LINPYPDWLNAGDNAWQLVAATLVGLMSILGIAVLHGALVQKKWVVNTIRMGGQAHRRRGYHPPAED